MNISLNKLKTLLEIYLKEKGIKTNLKIHYTTSLSTVKANIQGSKNEYDILISGKLEFDKIIEALSHETAHITTYSNHGIEFIKEKNNIKKYLENKLKIKKEER